MTLVFYPLSFPFYNNKIILELKTKIYLINKYIINFINQNIILRIKCFLYLLNIYYIENNDTVSRVKLLW